MNSVTTTSKEYFVFGNEQFARVESISGSQVNANEATFFLYDHLGNTRVAFQYSGNSALPHTIVNAVDYYPYGKVLREYDNGDGDRYLSTGHERDDETGLDYRGARYYDSDVARFLSIDPWAIIYPNLSTYSYVLGNPIQWIDPTGKSAEAPDDLVETKWTENHVLLNQIFGDNYNFNGIIAEKVNESKKTSKKGVAFIASWEKFEPKIYDDNGSKAGGTLTIGYGHVVKKGEDFSKGITKEEAIILLQKDIKIAEDAIKNNVTRGLTQYQFDALVSYVFNTGSLRGTKLLQYLNKGDFSNAVKQMDINTQDGEYVQGLENRREDERNMFKSGVYKMHK